MYVTDTHAFLYYSLGDRRRLGRRARGLFHASDDGRSLVYIPSIVLWEVAILVEKGHLEPPLRFDHWCRTIEASCGFSIVPLDWTDVDEARKLPFSDPHDRLIAGTAIRLDMPLITRDETITRSRLLETVW